MNRPGRHWNKRDDRVFMFSMVASDCRDILYFYDDCTYQIKSQKSKFYAIWKIEGNQAYYCHIHGRSDSADWYEFCGEAYKLISSKVDEYVCEQILLNDD